MRCVHTGHSDIDCYIKQTTVTIIIFYRVATELLPITNVSTACIIVDGYCISALRLKTKCVKTRGGEVRGGSLEVVGEGGGGGGGS